MKVFAPGKLILSGEHAVVYGQPALAMAVNRYVIATAKPHILPGVSFDLSDLAYQRRLSFSALSLLKKRLKKNYERFIQGDFKIYDVLQKPFELAQVALMLFVEMLNIKLTQGIKIHLQSDIPMGCGMGSSAATILSLMHAIAAHLEMDVPHDLLFRLGLQAENMQHGFSSGLDLRISLHGGCLYLKDGETFSRAIPQMKMFLVNTGTPETTTGECVSAVASYFKESSIAKDFSSATHALDQALQKNHWEESLRAIAENHFLLTKIGVVPERIQKFISEIELQSGAAKICGAGAVRGDTAGVVLVFTEEEELLKLLCENYRYEILPVMGETRGVHVV